MVANATFPSEKNDRSLQNFDIFDKDEFADTSDNLDDNKFPCLWMKIETQTQQKDRNWR